LDDFRFQPFLSTTQAYVYDKQSGDLTYVLDNNNLFTRYEYDGMGRLKAVYTEQFGRAPFKVKEYQQHYRSIN
jgi:YD repeat-containing protein